VIRNSKVIQIPTFEIAVGDLCITEEGNLINADGTIVHSNDFSVNQSSLTGEAFLFLKTANQKIIKYTAEQLLFPDLLFLR
jgi:Ca2+-transporting ATPase